MISEALRPADPHDELLKDLIMVEAARSLALGIAVAATLFAAPASAAVISYTEGSDLSGASASPTALGALGIGTNTITGSISCASGCSTGDFADYFNVTLAAGQKITSITVALSNFSQSNGAIGIVDANGQAIAPIAFSTNINNGNTPGTLTLFTGSAAGPGTQGFHLGITGGGSSSRALDFDYEVDIMVADASVIGPNGDGQAAPEPATLALLGAGLFGLAATRRRKAS